MPGPVRGILWASGSLDEAYDSAHGGCPDRRGTPPTPIQEEIDVAERALRGSRLGAQSYETDLGVEMAPRQSVTYECPREHRFSVPFSLEADVPEVWECTVCGAEALRLDGTRPEPKKGKPARTHWDMLLERRSVAELEEVLAERLAVLHENQGKIKAALKAGKKSA